MIAWSLSGGGNRGPVQVGAMRALFENGIQPAMLVGTSAGALNSAFLATDPTPAGVERLARIWLATKGSDIFQDSWLSQAIRFVTGADSLNSNGPLKRYIDRNIPPGVQTFGDLKCRLYITTADLQSGQLYLYGDDPSARLIDAVLASTALPPGWPPIEVGGRQFVDGGVVANVPISIAIDKGADTIYALDLEGGAPYPAVHGVYPIATRTLAVVVYQQLLRDIERAIRFSQVTLHHIYLGNIFAGISLKDFSHTAEMIERGYQRTLEYLAHPAPNTVEGLPAFGAAGAAAPPGAMPYTPRQ
ncbi:MAG: patatin-like phospholipase family protein [Rudaea sp.]